MVVGIWNKVKNILFLDVLFCLQSKTFLFEYWINTSIEYAVALTSKTFLFEYWINTSREYVVAYHSCIVNDMICNHWSSSGPLLTGSRSDLWGYTGF